MRILEKLDSTINIRPAQNNRSRGVEDSVTRGRIKEAVKNGFNQTAPKKPSTVRSNYLIQPDEFIKTTKKPQVRVGIT